MRSLLALWTLAIAACSSSSTPSGATPDAGSAEDALATAVDAGDTGASAESGGDTWASYASGFAATYCVECHDSSDPQGRDYTKYARVAAEKDAIRCGVCVAHDPSWDCPSAPAAKQFPISDGKTPANPKPTDADRTRFVAWLTAGAPQ